MHHLLVQLLQHLLIDALALLTCEKSSSCAPKGSMKNKKTKLEKRMRKVIREGSNSEKSVHYFSVLLLASSCSASSSWALMFFKASSSLLSSERAFGLYL